MKIIFGLGNPGPKYSLTRHNIGFMALDKLAARWDAAAVWRSEKNCQIAECRSHDLSPSTSACPRTGERGNGEKILLVKPQTYMNLSGEAAAALVNWYKITANDIIVIYDDTALPAGRLRLRVKGSSGGHRGIDSLIACLGTDAFLRLKIGVNQPPSDWDMADYVLAKIGREEMLLFDGALEKAADAVECILKYGAVEAMNRFN